MHSVMNDLSSTDNRTERSKLAPEELAKLNQVELREWLDSLEYVLASGGGERVVELLAALKETAERHGVDVPFVPETSYVNTIAVHEQPEYPGDIDLEKKITNMIRWNAMALVVLQNRLSNGIGGHIASYASSATLYEVGFNHFFRGPNKGPDADLVYFQGHASPGIYARSYLEGRIDAGKMHHFRRELQADGPGLSSYPHPFLMPDYWSFPTVSMGLGPITSIYQARFRRYLEDRGLYEKGDGKVWAFIGDGETDEPETLGAIRVASRNHLDNLIWVINCNLQRLDGPVYGNGQIIQELEGIFRGSGWNVIKVAWGSKWDELLAKDTEGHLVRRFEELVDGESQRYAAFGGPELESRFFNTPELKALIEGWSTEDIGRLNRGGHDPEKVYAAFARASKPNGKPTVILTRTVKGYGMGSAGEAQNVTHQQKQLDEDEMRAFRDRFNLPISDEEINNAPFLRLEKGSAEEQYLLERREALGGFIPHRNPETPTKPQPAEGTFDEFLVDSGEREVSTTMVTVNILRKLLRDKEWGKHIVPIIPDEARTFGMDPLFRQVGIYSPVGQLYEPVDSANLLYYKESTDGQILEEGITESGAMSSFIAAGTSYANYGVPMMPFYVFYSMFGFQRVGDLIWAAADSRAKGFMFGATAGRTTLAGEGLQHQDGHSHVLASTVPGLRAYDPAFGHELALIIKHGFQEMYEDGHDVMYYITIGNENYRQIGMPEHLSASEVEEGVLNGMYLLRKGAQPKAKLEAQLLGSGSIMNDVLRAAEILENDYGVNANVWSVTSYKELHVGALRAERHNRLRPEADKQVSWLEQQLGQQNGVVVASSDYMKSLPDSIAKHLPHTFVSLGTDGFGRSEARAELRDFFEVDTKHVVFATLTALASEGKFSTDDLVKAREALGINPDKKDPYVD